eukprot:4763621-Amphidinium_carterae.1
MFIARRATKLVWISLVRLVSNTKKLNTVDPKYFLHGGCPKLELLGNGIIDQNQPKTNVNIVFSKMTNSTIFSQVPHAPIMTSMFSWLTALLP